MTAMSFSIATTLPLTTVPSLISCVAEGFLEQRREIVAARRALLQC